MFSDKHLKRRWMIRLPAVAMALIWSGISAPTAALSSDWTTEAVDSAGHVGISNALAYDPAGNPAIAYYDFSNSKVKFARWNPTDGWQTEVVGGAPPVASPAIAYDPLTVPPSPTLCYVGTGSKLMFARLVGSRRRTAHPARTRRFTDFG